MSTRSAFAALAFTLVAGTASGEGPNLGKPITEGEIAPWDISIMPDGTGLPAGSGTAAQGAKIFAERCSSCHGDNGKGTEFGAAIVGGPPRATLDGGKTIRNYWPYATTLFDYIRRAMPYVAPQSLTPNELYSLCAYILFLNGVIGETDEMNATTLPKVKMPNRDNFVSAYTEPKHPSR